MRDVPADDISADGINVCSLLPFLCSVVSIVSAADDTSVRFCMGKAAAFVLF
jgi:hypothetical protein